MGRKNELIFPWELNSYHALQRRTLAIGLLELCCRIKMIPKILNIIIIVKEVPLINILLFFHLVHPQCGLMLLDSAPSSHQPPVRLSHYTCWNWVHHLNCSVVCQLFIKYKCSSTGNAVGMFSLKKSCKEQLLIKVKSYIWLTERIVQCTSVYYALPPYRPSVFLMSPRSKN